MRRFLLLAAAGIGALLGPLAPANATVNAQTGTSYVFLNTDCDPTLRTVVTFNNAAAVAVTLPQAGGSGNFAACTIIAENIGLGTVTITPTTSTVNGQVSMQVAPGASSSIYSDSNAITTGNYWATAGGAGPNGPSPSGFRNLVQNGGMGVQQRGTGTITCAQNAAINNAAYTADRWGCSANVAVGAGRGAASTTTPPAGLPGVLNIFRTSGALLQPVCAIQEIATADIKPVAGNVMTLSFYAKADAGLSADNGSVINATIITGTGTDEGLQTMTASPAITPAFTGVASGVTKAFTLTTSYVRYSMTGVLPSAATEAAVAICFTPTATGAGATDGFFFTGVQYENGAVTTPFELKTPQIELAIAQRHYWQITDPAATVEIPSSCFVTAANTTVKCGVYLPQVMRVAPTTAISTATSFGIVVTAGTAGTCTTLAATASSNSTQSIGVTCTTGGTIALGSATPLIGAATVGTLSAFADY